MKTPAWDIVVVGASCAGLVTARDAARAGLRVLVLDSRPSFDAPARTWIVTPRLERLLDCDFESSVVHRTGVMDMQVNGSRVRVELERPDLVVERSELRRVLAREATGAGARIELGHRVLRLDTQRTPLKLVTGGNGNGVPSVVDTRHVVGADGVRSVVADAIGAGPQAAVPIVQARVALPEGYDPDVTRVWFHRGRTRFFYWLIPESRETGAAGLIAESPTTARRLLEDFLREERLEVLEYQGAMIPLHRLGRRLEARAVGGRVLLVGDAASHVKVTTVGGVVSGIRGAHAAARALARGTSYGTELRGLRTELAVHDLVRWLMDRFEDRHYDRLLALLEGGRLRDLLGRHDRDSIAPMALTLLGAEPRLVALALRAVVNPAASSFPAESSAE